MKSTLIKWLIFCLMITSCTPTIKEDKYLVENLLKSQPEYFKNILDKKEEYGVQIIYTQIDRDSVNNASFRSFSFNTDPERYFYPASTVKLPAALLALEKLNELNIEGLNFQSVMHIDSAFSGQSTVLVDTTSSSGHPSIEHYIKKIFVVSDNDAFNRLYEFIGQEEINKKLKAKGYEDSRIIHRLSIFLSEEENRRTNPVKFFYKDSLIYSQPAAYNASDLPLKGQKILKGKGYMKDGNLISEPMDFTGKNFIPLDEMQMMLRALLFPEYVDQKYKFNLTENDYRLLYQYMSQLPPETTYPQYDTAEYYDAYSKILMYGNDRKQLPKNIRIFNKYGQSYGYLIDNAYIIDTEKNVEFLLSAVIQTNKNEIYNDNIYEYEEVGYPFMKNLGQLIYNYELNRKRKYTPDLSRYIVSYDNTKRITKN